MRSSIWLPFTFCLALAACGDTATELQTSAHANADPAVAGILARVVYNTIDPVGMLSRNGHQITATGPISCDAGEWLYMRVSVTQRTTGAVAEGRSRIACTGSLQTWQVQLSQNGGPAFAAGAATAVALARTTARGRPTDAHQWLVDITLAESSARTVVARSSPALFELGIVARIVTNTIDPVGTLSRKGRQITATGPISCDAGEWSDLRVTVTQRTTGAVAEGRSRIACTGTVQTWQVQLSQNGGPALEAGAATAVALARTTERGTATDAHQWLVGITLSE